MLIICMQLLEVAILIREIADQCPGLEGSTFTLLPQKAKPTFKRYSINIKRVFPRESIGGLRKTISYNV